MSSSGLIYAVIVGAWAAYLVPMWLRRQDELNEARPTERFSTAIRLLSGRAAMERRYAKDLQARSTGPDEPPGEAPRGDAVPDPFTGSVDVRALAMPTTRDEPRPAPGARPGASEPAAPAAGKRRWSRRAEARETAERPSPAEPSSAADRLAADRRASDTGPQRAAGDARRPATGARRPAAAQQPPATQRPSAAARPSAAEQVPGQSVSARYEPGRPAGQRPGPVRGVPGQQQAPGTAPARRASDAEAAARARRSKVLARRRRTTAVLFVAFTLGAVAAAIGGLAFLWAPAVPAVLLSAYIAYLRAQERRRFTYTMDRRRAEAAAQRLRERPARGGSPGPGRPAAAANGSEAGGPDGPDGPEGEPEPAIDPGLSSLAADRRALVEQTDHAEWVDQQRERRQGPAGGASWDPVPVPLPTYVTAPVAPRAGGDVDLGAPDTWSSARSSAAEPPARDAGARERTDNAEQGARRARNRAEASGREATGRRESAGDSATGSDADDQDGAPGGPPGSRGAPSARPQRRKGRGGSAAGARGGSRSARERGRTPLFDQYEDGEPPRAAGQ